MTVRVETMPIDRTEARSDRFTEQEAFWNVPLHETNIICDIAVTKGNTRNKNVPYFTSVLFYFTGDLGSLFPIISSEMLHLLKKL